jgi:hypothetical protein
MRIALASGGMRLSISRQNGQVEWLKSHYIEMSFQPHCGKSFEPLVLRIDFDAH